MRRALRPCAGSALTLAALLSTLVASSARAELEADLVLVEGTSFRQLLPAIAAAARTGPGGAASPLPAIVTWDRGEERHTEALLRRLGPARVLSVGAGAERSEPFAVPGRVRRVRGPAGDVDLRLAELAFPAGARAPARYLSDGEDLPAAHAGTGRAVLDRAPLLVADGSLAPALTEARVLAARLGAREIVILGSHALGAPGPDGPSIAVLDAAQALARYNARRKGARHLVLAAPSDAAGLFAPPRLSLAALPYALGKGAALAFVGAGVPGEPGPETVAAALEADGLGPFDTVTLVGDALAIPMRELEDVAHRDAAGRPRVHKLPSFVRDDGAPVDRAVGRLAALDLHDLSRWVARLLHVVAEPGGALILANADRKFVLGEAISRISARELENVRVPVAAYYRDEIDAALIRRELGGHALVLWEGHPRDLALDDDALPVPESPLPPSTYFLQGCYTLDRSDPFVLVERGADAVIGTYMAVYSASGSAFAKAFLEAQLARGATAGEALRSARNYLLATVELKKRRGHDDWRKTLRAALSFDLWGDPTAPPRLRRTSPKVPRVTARLDGARLSVTIPPARLPPQRSGDYLAHVRPGAQLSAIYRTDPAWGDERRLAEHFFVEVRLPESLGDAPIVEAEGLPADSWAALFAPRDRTLSLLVHDAALAGPKRAGTLHFRLRRGPPVKAAPGP